METQEEAIEEAATRVVRHEVPTAAREAAPSLPGAALSAAVGAARAPLRLPKPQYEQRRHLHAMRDRKRPLLAALTGSRRFGNSLFQTRGANRASPKIAVRPRGLTARLRAPKTREIPGVRAS